MHGEFDVIDAIGSAVILLLVVMLLLGWTERDWLWRDRRRTLISFDCRGCMAHDWREMDRGKISGSYWQEAYGSPRPILMYIVEREDGSTFNVIAANCQPGLAEMQARTDNPDEPLEGKIVCLQ